MKRLIAFVLIAAIVALAVVAFPNNAIVAFVIGLVSAAMYSIFFEDIASHLKTWLSIPIRTSKITIFLYGRGGSGKTTLIKSILSLEELRNRYQSSTEDSEYYEGVFNYAPNLGRRFKRKYTVPVNIADYKGQAPTQAIGLRKRFKSQVNVMLFIVDIVHPSPKSDGNMMSGEPMSDESLIEYLSSDTEKKINERFIQHVAYIGDAILSVIFSDILSANRNNLRSVRLVINKIDIVQRLMIKGCLPGFSSAEDYVKSKFSPIEKYVFEACRQNGIFDVKVEVVSLTSGTGVRDLFQGLIKAHFQALKIR